MAEHRQGQAPEGPQDDKSQRIGVIGAGQGAKVTTRENAAEAAERARSNAERRYESRHGSGLLRPSSHGAGRRSAGSSQLGPERSGRRVVIVVVAAIAVLLALFALGSCVTRALIGDEAAQQEETASQQGGVAANEDVDLEESAERTVAGVDETIVYQGTSYTIERQDGGYSVVATSGDGSTRVVFSSEGDPRALILFDGAILVPQNTAEGWDVMAVTLEGTSEAFQVAGADGSAVGGSGSIVEVSLSDTVLLVTDDAGATTDVALA